MENPVIAEAIECLESYDIEPTMENIKKEIGQWIENLYSHVGIEAHKHAENCGVVNETGMSWEEQDMLMLKEIERYKKCLAAL